MKELVGGVNGLGWVAVKAALMFAVAVAGLRIGERRTLAQLGAFDFAVAVAVGAIIGRTATSSSTSFATGAVALATLLVVHRIVAALRRHGWLGNLVDQPPRALITHGRIRPRELARAGLTTGDLYALLRERAVADVADVDYLLYETRGSITLVGRGDRVGPLVLDGLRAAGSDATTPAAPVR